MKNNHKGRDILIEQILQDCNEGFVDDIKASLGGAKEWLKADARNSFRFKNKADIKDDRKYSKEGGKIRSYAKSILKTLKSFKNAGGTLGKGMLIDDVISRMEQVSRGNYPKPIFNNSKTSSNPIIKNNVIKPDEIKTDEMKSNEIKPDILKSHSSNDKNILKNKPSNLEKFKSPEQEDMRDNNTRVSDDDKKYDSNPWTMGKSGSRMMRTTRGRVIDDKEQQPQLQLMNNIQNKKSALRQKVEPKANDKLRISEISKELVNLLDEYKQKNGDSIPKVGIDKIINHFKNVAQKYNSTNLNINESNTTAQLSMLNSIR